MSLVITYEHSTKPKRVRVLELRITYIYFILDFFPTGENVWILENTMLLCPQFQFLRQLTVLHETLRYANAGQPTAVPTLSNNNMPGL
jgi:hypothetical protein